MAPIRNNTHGVDRGDDDCTGIKSDRKMRKPLVEKKRRARINESLQELRGLITDADLQSKMENAEVLEMTVKRVESVLLNRAQGAHVHLGTRLGHSHRHTVSHQKVDTVNREASERFSAGYIQCMHDVHTFVSSCPGIDPAVAAELLNHLLESMPLNDQDRLRVMLQQDGPDTLTPAEGMLYSALVSPAPSSTTSSSCDDLCSDLDDTDSEHSHVSSSEESDSQDVLASPPFTYSKSVWRPW